MLTFLNSSLRKFYSRHHVLINRYGIAVSQMTTDMFRLFVIAIRSFPHSYHITGFVTRVTRPVPLVEQELLTLQEHMSSPTVFSEVRVARSSVFCVVFYVIACHFVLFFLVIVFSVLLRIKASGYPLGIFKLFLEKG